MGDSLSLVQLLVLFILGAMYLTWTWLYCVIRIRPGLAPEEHRRLKNLCLLVFLIITILLVWLGWHPSSPHQKLLRQDQERREQIQKQGQKAIETPNK